MKKSFLRCLLLILTTVIFLSGCGGGSGGNNQPPGDTLTQEELQQFTDLVGGDESIIGANYSFYMNLFMNLSMSNIALQKKLQTKVSSQLSAVIDWDQPDENGWYEGEFVHGTTTWTIRIRFFRSQNKLELNVHGTDSTMPSDWVTFTGSLILGTDSMPLNGSIDVNVSNGTVHRFELDNLSHCHLSPACPNPIVDPVLYGTMDHYLKLPSVTNFDHTAHIISTIDLAIPSQPYLVPQVGSWYDDGYGHYPLTPANKMPLFEY
jgi:hypothetical protein